ncbi:MAG: ATP-binding protein [Candidatus Cloacimonadales bacterium]|nr:ATP-binding protein [Candidatus Cloacimonadales bacterium]
MKQKLSLFFILFALISIFLQAQETSNSNDFDALMQEKTKHDSIILSQTSPDNIFDPNTNTQSRVNYNNMYRSGESMQKTWPFLILLIIAFILVIVLLIIQFSLRKRLKTIQMIEEKKSQHKTRTLLKSIETQKQDLLRLRNIESNYRSMQATQEQLKEKVKKSELLQKAIIALKYPVVLTNLHGIIIFCNLEFAEMHGHKASDFLGKKISTVFPEGAKIMNTIDNRQDWENKVLKVVTRHKNGTENNLYCKSALLLDADNKPSSILTTFDAIPEVSQDESTVEYEKTCKEKLKIFENIQDVYYEVSINGYIKEISHSISKISDIPREELIGKEMKILYANDEQRKNFVAALKKEQDLNDYEISLKGKNGSVVPCTITARLLLDDDKMPSSIVGSIRKISQRNKVEEISNKAIEDLKIVNKDLLDFAYITSHDLKSPLRAINTLANWVMMDEENKMSEEAKGQMQLLINRTERMHNLIDAIFDYTNIVSFEGEKSNVEMNKMLAGLQNRMQIPNNISIKVQENIPSLYFEKSRIEQVFENLIDNSIKFMDKDKGLIVIEWAERPKEYEFSVTDNGPGIDPKYFDKVFQIFQTLKPRDEVEGVGIGLAIVRKIITKYGGKIWLKSEPGKGLAVSFIIPKNGNLESV